MFIQFIGCCTVCHLTLDFDWLNSIVFSKHLYNGVSVCLLLKVLMHEFFLFIFYLLFCTHRKNMYSSQMLHLEVERAGENKEPWPGL